MTSYIAQKENKLVYHTEDLYSNQYIIKLT